jgi:hypothetical protein
MPQKRWPGDLSRLHVACVYRRTNRIL